jgi:hypothetical protein
LLVYATFMFHLFVSNTTTSLPLYFHRAATSSLPPTARPPPLTHAEPHSCPLPPWRAGAGHLEAARHPFFFYLSHRASPPSLSYPPGTTTTESSSEPFTSITPPVKNSPHHHVRNHPAPLLILSAPPRAVLVGRMPFSSLIPTRGATVSTSPWPGHLGYSLCHLNHVLCTLYGLYAHARAFFSSAHVATSECSHLPRFTSPEPPSLSHNTVYLVSVLTMRMRKSC